MKIKETFVLREVAGERIVLPLDQSGFGKLQSYALSEEAALLWHMLEAGAEQDYLVNAYRDAAAVSEREAQNDVQTFLTTLKELGALED